MLLWISWFISGLITVGSAYYIFSTVILEKKISIKKSDIAVLAIYSAVNTFVIIYGARSIRLLINFMTACYSLYIIFRQKFSKTVISTFLIFLIYSISEMIYIFIYRYVFGFDPILVSINPIHIIITNICIAIISIIIFKIKKVSKIINNVIEWYIKKETLNLFFITLISILSIFIFMNRNMKTFVDPTDYLINAIVGAFIIILAILVFKEATDKNKVSFDYDQLLTYVKAYENMAEQKSKNQHEHNNQLSYIRGMVEAKDPDNEIISYIDKLLDNQKNTEDEKLLNELKFLPGGLKGFIHYKILSMKESKIDVTVYVSDDLKKKDNWNLYKEYQSEISHILGVYLDNAKDAAVTAAKKYIIIDTMYDNGNLIFSISNTYKGDINLDKMDNVKYSTKGKGRGYGLSIVKDIIDKSSHIEQSREIRGIYFIQNLIIKK